MLTVGGLLLAASAGAAWAAAGSPTDPAPAVHLGFGLLLLLLVAQYGLAYNRGLTVLRALVLWTLVGAIAGASLFLVERGVAPRGGGYVVPLVLYDLAALALLTHWLLRPALGRGPVGP